MIREEPRSSDQEAHAAREAAGHEFDLGSFIPYLLMRISGRLGKNLAAALKQMGLTPAHWRVLATLADRDGRTLTELSVYTTIDHSTLSRIIDRLAADGQVERHGAEDDGRAVSVFITEQGRESFRRILPIAMAQYEWAVRDMDDAELEQFRATLMKMLEAVRISPYP